MKRVVVFGAGLVARPLIRYLLDHGYGLTVAALNHDRAVELLEGHPNGTALPFDADDEATLRRLVADHELTVSLLPPWLHATVAKACIDSRRSMATTSYISDEIRALNGPAQDAGVTLLMEMGADPGIDHMSVRQINDRVAKEGGRILSLKSLCGGLPSPPFSNNPWRYKFSWSPRGVLLAGKNSARWLREGEVVEIDGPQLFDHIDPKTIKEIDFECYPNRDSLPYREIYGVEDVHTIIRGTLRYPGFCRGLQQMTRLGLLEEGEKKSLEGLSKRDFLRTLVPGTGDLRRDLANKLELEGDDPFLEQLGFLSFFDEDALPIDEGTPLDVLIECAVKTLAYEDGETDMLAMYHEFEIQNRNGERELLGSTLVEHGIPNGDSAMARAVSLTCAIGCRLLLEDKYERVGATVPTTPDLYDPVLDELASLGIVLEEKTTPLP